MEKFWDIVTVVVPSLLGGGMLGAYFNYKSNSKSQSTNDFQILLEAKTATISALEERIKTLEIKLEQITKTNLDYRDEINTLRNQLMTFESSHLDLPVPMWLKDTNGVMLYLNKEYENDFLLPRGMTTIDYIGKTDEEVWGKGTSNHFRAIDEQVIRDKKSIRAIEKLEDSKGNIFYVDVIKYPRFFNRNVIGVGGIILRTSSNKEDLKNGTIK